MVVGLCQNGGTRRGHSAIYLFGNFFVLQADLTLEGPGQTHQELNVGEMPPAPGLAYSQSDSHNSQNIHIYNI